MRTRLVTLVAAVGLALVVLPAIPASAKGLSQSQIKALENNINNAKKQTYQITYESVDGSKTSTVTIAQSQGKSNFTTSDGGSVISTGKKTYYCQPNSSSNSGSTGNSGNSGNSGTTTTTKASAVQCTSTSGTSPLLGLENAFSPTALIAILNENKSSAVARALGIKVTTSSQTIAGQPTTCVLATVHGQSGKYCVTKQGLLAYVGSNKGTVFKMTKYSSKPSASLFVLPAGATTVTTPSIPNVSIPDVSIPDVSIP
jgi:outer membrane lipoprotein-sorting protein